MVVAAAAGMHAPASWAASSWCALLLHAILFVQCVIHATCGADSLKLWSNLGSRRSGKGESWRQGGLAGAGCTCSKPCCWLHTVHLWRP